MALGFLKQFLARQLYKRKRRLTQYISNAKRDAISKQPNTSMAADVFFGEGTTISLHKGFKEFKLGSKVFFRNYCNILVYPDAVLEIGNKVFFNNYCSINCLKKIEIGSGTSIGEGVKFYDHNHKHSYAADGTLLLESDVYTYGEIKVGKNCWIGSNVTILKGVEIGDNVIIGANCLIYKSVPSNSVVKQKGELIITNHN
jgi:acetyltransferase-like isoleucine patch superfamily enzyme